MWDHLWSYIWQEEEETSSEQQVILDPLIHELQQNITGDRQCCIAERPYKNQRKIIDTVKMYLDKVDRTWRGSERQVIAKELMQYLRARRKFVLFHPRLYVRTWNKFIEFRDVPGACSFSPEFDGIFHLGDLSEAALITEIHPENDLSQAVCSQCGRDFKEVVKWNLGRPNVQTE